MSGKACRHPRIERRSCETTAWAAGLAMVLIAAVPALAQPKDLRGSGEVVITTGGGSWEAAQKKAYFEPFEKETGIKVVLVPGDSGKLLASIERGRPEADLTNLSAGVITSFINRNALQKIDYKYFDAETLEGMRAVLRHEYGVGAILYAIVMAFNEKEYPAEKPRPQNWSDFFDVKRFPGPRGLSGCGDRLISGGGLEFAMLASGADKDSIYPIDLERAFGMLAALKPHVGRWWQMGGEAPQGLIDGELAMSTAFNGRIYAARQQGAAVGLNWHHALVQYDYWVVPRNSPNAENAMKFLAFVSRAKPQADFANLMAFGPVNTKAYAYIKPDLAEWLPGSPKTAAQSIYQDYRWWSEQGPDGKTNWERAMARCIQALAQ
ncbi:ABC transporter substrate-binding protein [uncultured Ferrovibrio sp.]|jgi:putative spermidine/putrescine transport system substrate-binding protein|uniref:ABC transporter substrate-binding protein n=1 Tax=uncultured Ferrovibrio sp. TaxID=1576913 RepID=UPI00262A4128|nr:ABC transporter substrate-binding protein [uncultured Ferrovibrio sp.]